MIIVKLSSPAGSNIYDPNIWTEQEMKDDYIDTFGVESTKRSSFHFDVIKGSELTEWINE
tara:strand:- start:400 stop:579 length:180 start_codon:yes stop_codon:yes gene_type:complete